MTRIVRFLCEVYLLPRGQCVLLPKLLETWENNRYVLVLIYICVMRKRYYSLYPRFRTIVQSRKLSRIPPYYFSCSSNVSRSVLNSSPALQSSLLTFVYIQVETDDVFEMNFQTNSEWLDTLQIFLLQTHRGKAYTLIPSLQSFFELNNEKRLDKNYW